MFVCQPIFPDFDSPIKKKVNVDVSSSVFSNLRMGLLDRSGAFAKHFPRKDFSTFNGDLLFHSPFKSTSSTANDDRAAFH
jgi:hypothetical protein